MRARSLGSHIIKYTTGFELLYTLVIYQTMTMDDYIWCALKGLVLSVVGMLGDIMSFGNRLL